jgi:hypothetical protein
MCKLTFLLILFVPFLFLSCKQSPSGAGITPGWPQTTNECKPWSRWWWMGSSVDEENLTKLLKTYSKAGLGGMEITPIYGVKGQEDKFINFTSERWMKMLQFTVETAKELDMGIDMALASGWPFGGPWVKPDDACQYLEFKKYEILPEQPFQEKIVCIQKPLVKAVNKSMPIEKLKFPISANDSLQVYAFDQIRYPISLPLVALTAYSENGDTLDLTNEVTVNGKLNHKFSEGRWTLVAAFKAWHGKMVERAGPGGEGDVIDHFSKKALSNYLEHFDKRFSNVNISGLRAFFNDSYEVDDAQGEANFTPALFETFKKNRNYDLKKHLIALLPSDANINADYRNRIICDYRETISELILENFTKEWSKWSHNKGKIIRNQSHGSPANILDLYSASDIPETEGTNILNIKAASSAAHLSGKKLVSAEAATWLNEHFLGTLAQSKENVDRYFIGGINHIIYHGTCYSPENAPWPGNLFYASTHYAPSNPIWKEFPTLNKYIERVQSFLQKGVVDNDILLYYPIHDEWMKPGNETIPHFHGVKDSSSLEKIANELHNKGYSFDYISDKQLSELEVKDMKIFSGNKEYKTIMVPKVEYMPLNTFKKIITLADNGAKVLFYNNLPNKIPGWKNHTDLQEQFDKLKAALKFDKKENDSQETLLSLGKILKGPDIPDMLTNIGIYRETLVDKNLEYIRLNYNKTKVYFISNWSDNLFDSELNLKSEFSTAVIYNPMTGEYGKAKTMESDGEKKVLLQLRKGESCIIQLCPGNVDIGDFLYLKHKKAEAVTLNNNWRISYTEGGPEIPESQNLSSLSSWTDFPDEKAHHFSGTALYTLDFELNSKDAKFWELNLGEVFNSASIKLNNTDLGVLIGSEYRLRIDSGLFKDKNILEIEVTNLMANRIIYMDKNEIPYRIFYNTNFNSKYKENMGEDLKFTSKHWNYLKSGLIGPVNLIPLDEK